MATYSYVLYFWWEQFLLVGRLRRTRFWNFRSSSVLSLAFTKTEKSCQIAKALSKHERSSIPIGCSLSNQIGKDETADLPSRTDEGEKKARPGIARGDQIDVSLSCISVFRFWRALDLTQMNNYSNKKRLNSFNSILAFLSLRSLLSDSPQKMHNSERYWVCDHSIAWMCGSQHRTTSVSQPL